MIAYIRELYEYRHLIFYLAWGQIKGGERDRWFGRLWNILDPLALLVIYYFVFNIAFQSRKENFEVFLFTGIIAFRFFSTTVKSNAMSVFRNRTLALQAYFPKAILSVAYILAYLHDFIFGTIVLWLLALFRGIDFTPFLLLWPLIMLVQITFVLGISLLATHVGVYFRDIENILTLLFRFLFYFSGVMYDLSRIPEKYHEIFNLNPLFVLFQSYRAVLIYGKHPAYLHLAVIFALSLGLIGVGLYIVRKNEGGYLKVL